MKKYPELRFTCPEDQLIRLATVLQSGFHVKGTAGNSIFSLLTTIPGFTEAYIVDEIQTIFFNGDAIDDMEAILHGPTATIALAGAMPGLAGAIVRKGSPWGALRKTRTTHDTDSTGDQIDVLIKLFNTVAADKGADVLTQAVRINALDLIHFLELRPSLLHSFRDITLDGAPIAVDKLNETIASHDQLQVKVRRS